MTYLPWQFCYGFGHKPDFANETALPHEKIAHIIKVKIKTERVSCIRGQKNWIPNSKKMLKES